ncbi:phosphate acyltransferase [Gudongella sp. SC589]|jgi:phosphate butyryltransferase|uniref:phosphate acyltransferase n=1 Tax=Gudongella sp. SC589 TaxID=3385990 RepID=UPI0039048FE7
MIKDFKELIERASRQDRVTIAVAGAQDAEVIEAVSMAENLGLVEPILVGNKGEIEKIANGMGLSNYRVIHGETPEESSSEAVNLVRSGEAKVLMKGFVNTSIYLRAILDKANGLRTGRLLSLLAAYEIPQYHKLLYCTDSGVNPSPDLEQKKVILQNSLMALQGFGMEMPKVAALAANENVDQKIQSTVDADGLVNMAKRNEVERCIIEGPMAFDVAFDPKAAAHKGIDSKITGDVDLLLFPNMETGNSLGKSWLLWNNAKWAGIILGASAPVVLGSRSDTAEIKLNSIALACLASNIKERGN